MIEFFHAKNRFSNYTTIGKTFAVFVCGPMVWLFYLGCGLRLLLAKIGLPQLYERIMVKPEFWKLQEYTPKPPKPAPPPPDRNIRVETTKKKRWVLK